MLRFVSVESTVIANPTIAKLNGIAKPNPAFEGEPKPKANDNH